MSHSKKNNKQCDCDLCKSRSFFSGKSLIDAKSLLSNLKYGQRVYFDPSKQDWVVDSTLKGIIAKLKDKATEERFGDMEFALDEDGRPDGIKNKQEMVLTIANDIANSVSEMAFEEAKQALERDDWIDTKAMELLKEGKEK